MTIYEQLMKIQTTLKAPKNQYNSFGKYHYRSCEDILEAVKPLLYGFVLVIKDEIVQIGNRYYVKATAELMNDKEKISNTAYAREEEDKKGMDGSQITGAASSYARKYALNGLFLIDDQKDADTMDNTKKEIPHVPPPSVPDRPVDQPDKYKTSKDILFDELSEHCVDAEGLIDTNLRDSIVSQIATKKDGTPIKSWEDLDKIDGVKYEKWFSSMLKKFRER